MSTPNASGWYGVDLDGTLAFYDQWRGPDHIGDPIPAMLERVKTWLAQGRTVKIFTARMHDHGVPLIGGGFADVRGPIERWCHQHLGQVLEVTNVKDFAMLELWDDRAVRVEMNTGRVIEQPAKSTPHSLAKWLMSDDTGASSKTMAAVMFDFEISFLRGSYFPLDASDFGRCVRFLEAVPEARERLPRMKQVSAKWAVLVDCWDELTALYHDEKRGDKVRTLTNKLDSLYRKARAAQ